MGGGRKNSATFLQALSVTQKKRLLSGHYPIITAFHLEEFSPLLLSVHLGGNSVQYNQDEGIYGTEFSLSDGRRVFLLNQGSAYLINKP